MSLTAIDIAVLTIVGVSCLIGVLRGLVKEALSLAFWIGGIVAAGVFSDDLGALMSGAISNPALQRVAGFIVIFLAVVFIGGLISSGISHLLSEAGLGVADRALGAVFGVVRGLAIIVVIVMVTGRFSFAQRFYSNSVTMPYVISASEWLQAQLGDVLPDGNETVSESAASA